jgi:MraZ protein
VLLCGKKNTSVLDLNGDHQVSIDDKHRFLFPAALRKQFPADERKTFWVNRDECGCLRLYSVSEWEVINGYIRKLNPLDPEVANFRRMFRFGATQIDLDNAGRMRLTTDNLDYASIGDKAVLVGQMEYVEIWNPDKLKEFHTIHRGDYTALQKKMASGEYMNPFTIKDEAAK